MCVCGRQAGKEAGKARGKQYACKRHALVQSSSSGEGAAGREGEAVAAVGVHVATMFVAICCLLPCHMRRTRHGVMVLGIQGVQQNRQAGKVCEAQVRQQKATKVPHACVWGKAREWGNNKPTKTGS